MNSHAWIVLAIAASFVTGCGTDCLTLAKEYAAEKDNALICDPTASSPCGVARPQVVALQDGSNIRIEGLDVCTHSVNPARIAKLDRILADYTSMHCKVLATPLCAAPMDKCIQSSPGHYTCAP
jgi:hypothetical protein